MNDISENNIKFSIFAGELLKTEKTKPSNKEELVRQLYSHFSNEEYSNKWLYEIKAKINKCRTYPEILTFLANKFLYGENFGNRNTFGKNTRKLKPLMRALA